MGRTSQLSPLTVALVAKLTGDTTLMALLGSDGGVWNSEAPIGAELPYITLGFLTESDNNVFAAPGTEVGQTLDIWTRKSTVTGGATAQLGNDSLLAIYARVRWLLHLQPLTISGFRHVMGTLSLVATMQDPDGKSLHAVTVFDCIARES